MSFIRCKVVTSTRDTNATGGAFATGMNGNMQLLAHNNAFTQFITFQVANDEPRLRLDAL